MASTANPDLTRLANQDDMEVLRQRLAMYQNDSDRLAQLQNQNDSDRLARLQNQNYNTRGTIVSQNNTKPNITTNILNNQSVQNLASCVKSGITNFANFALNQKFFLYPTLIIVPLIILFVIIIASSGGFLMKIVSVLLILLVLTVYYCQSKTVSRSLESIDRINTTNENITSPQYFVGNVNGQTPPVGT